MVWRLSELSLINATLCEKMEGRFEYKTPAEVKVYVKQHISSIEDTVLEAIVKHKIDGATFLQLTDEYLREIFPLLGDRLKVKKLVCDLITSEPEEVIIQFYDLVLLLLRRAHIQVLKH